MTYEEGKIKFISTWGSLGSLWGINKAMAQIQALLFISTKPLSDGGYYGGFEDFPWKH